MDYPLKSSSGNVGLTVLNSCLQFETLATLQPTVYKLSEASTGTTGRLNVTVLATCHVFDPNQT
eukprot:1200528-Amphidinium_carterae.1